MVKDEIGWGRGTALFVNLVPHLKKAKIDLEALGNELAERKQTLISDFLGDFPLSACRPGSSS